MSEPSWVRKIRPHQLRLVTRSRRLNARLLVHTFAPQTLPANITLNKAKYESKNIRSLRHRGTDEQ